MKKILFLSFLVLPVCVNAENSGKFFIPNTDFKTTEEILEIAHSEKPTDCASMIFANALKDNLNTVSENDSEFAVRAWAKNTMLDAPILEQILECPEIKATSDDTQIAFSPIEYKFPNGRTITINYSTTPKVLKQHLLLATKPSLPNGAVSPKLMDPDDPAKYLDTEPAWYAIMVVQHDALSEFVGPGKNNTLSMKYINDNIKKLYPRGYHCTSKSAITLGNNYDTINKVVHEVVDIENDKNDYYVFGDVNLEWVMYAEIAADVIITIATWGGGAVAAGALKWVRAGRTADKLKDTLRAARTLDDVQDYMKAMRQVSQHSDDIAKLSKNIKNAEKYQDLMKKADQARKLGKDTAKYEKEAKEVLEAARKINPKTTAESLKNIDKLKDQEKTLTDALKVAEKDAQKLRETSENVKKYEKELNALEDIIKYQKELTAFRRRQTGNVIVRNLKKVIKPIRAAKNGAKEMNRAARIARAGMSSRSAKMADWLKDATLKYGSRLARFKSKVGGIYGIISFLGDMWDKTSAISKEFSNGIEFKPLLLLGADDLQGQENVVNYGMWFMWTGNSIDTADDDAAYLQAMDFATKFYYQLDEYQDEHGADCNVDIYVVHPIIRLDETNIDEPKGELFYLFMNEIPWSTATQFKEQITDIDAWEQNQQQLETNDPDNKYKRKNINENVESVTVAN